MQWCLSSTVYSALFWSVRGRYTNKRPAQVYRTCTRYWIIWNIFNIWRMVFVSTNHFHTPALLVGLLPAFSFVLLPTVLPNWTPLPIARVPVCESSTTTPPPPHPSLPRGHVPWITVCYPIYSNIPPLSSIGMCLSNLSPNPLSVAPYCAVFFTVNFGLCNRPAFFQAAGRLCLVQASAMQWLTQIARLS